jgi:hypothetical protein
MATSSVSLAAEAEFAGPPYETWPFSPGEGGDLSERPEEGGVVDRPGRGWTVALLAVAVCSGMVAAAQEHTAPTPADLQGAWKLASLSYDGKPQQAIGYMLFAGDRYAFVTTRERPTLTREITAKKREELTSAEKDLYVQAYESMTAAAGTYAIEKGEIRYMREAVRSPQLAGTAEHRKSWLEKGRLVQDFQGGGRRQVYIWERVAGGPMK